MNIETNLTDCRDDKRQPTEIESLVPDYQRETQTITVEEHHAFREHCRDTLAEIQRIEREADLLTKAQGSKP